MSGVPIVAVKIEHYCFNHSERAPPLTVRQGRLYDWIKPKKLRILSAIRGYE
ncbi:hypothetical protein [Endozoicomonas sp.]|uniref:hypothetical protein n=1 Tax=Endozoicomonas sp. TaxID=1892382 RepID=UPI003AF4A846